MQKQRQGIKPFLVRHLAGLWRKPRLGAEELLRLQPETVLLVRQHNQMGDMICATPVLRALRETFPAAVIILVTAPVNVEVVRHNPHVDRILVFDQKLWHRPWRLFAFLQDLRRLRAEVAFVLGSVSFSITSAALALLSGARWVVGPDSRPYGWDLSARAFSLQMPSHPETDMPAIQHNLAPLQAIGITTPDLDPVVVPAPEEEAVAEGIMGKLGLVKGFWALHPGAGKKQNIWPADRFAAVAARAVGRGQKILVLHGPADCQALEDFRRALPAEAAAGVAIAPSTPVGVGAALLARAGRLLCNDTGIMHLAGALRVPTVALFGHTDPAIWKPPFSGVVALRSPGRSADSRGEEYGWLESIGTEEVWTAWSTL